MFPVNYRPPEVLPRHHRDFPPRDGRDDLSTSPDVHIRDTRNLLLFVVGYLLAMLGGIILLNAVAPTTHAAMDARHAIARQ